MAQDAVVKAAGRFMPIEWGAAVDAAGQFIPVE
jgi:hypothetical protein